MADYDDNKVEIIESNKGGLKLIFRGYMYTVHKRRTNGAIRWRCTQRSMLCKGSITTFGKNSTIPPTPNMPHNHVPDPYSVAMARSRRVRSFTDKPFDDELYEDDDINQSTSSKCDPPEIDIFDKPELHVEVIMDPPTYKAAMPSTPPVLTPVKMSQRILSQKAQQHLRMQAHQQGQKDSVKDPLEMVQKQASLTVRKIGETPRPPPTSEEDEVCLRWNSHYNNMQSVFPSLLAREQFVDVTLCSEGQSIRCHKLVLSACSPYFEEIITNMTPWQHPVIFIKGMPFWVLKALVDYMYVGETSIEQSKLKVILEAGEELKIKGLAAKASAPVLNHSFPKPAASPPSTPGIMQTTKVYKANVGKEQLVKLSAEDMHKIIAQKTIQQQHQHQGQKVMKEIPKKEPQEQVPKDLHAKKMLKAIVMKTKRPPKRRLSESATPVPEQLLFVRKGTKSRPLVKTPRFYHTEFEDDSKPAKVEKHEKYEARHIPNYTDPIDEETAGLGPQKMKRRDVPMDFKIVDIKQEPLDIGETDVSFGQEEELLGFDNTEEQPVQDSSLEGVSGKGGDVMETEIDGADDEREEGLTENAEMLQSAVCDEQNQDSCDSRTKEMEEVSEN